MPNGMPRILFVDDEPGVLSGLKRSLRKRWGSWEMLFEDSGEQALAHCRQAPCRVVVTDLMMPGMNGIELVRALNAEFPKTACIMLSGTADLQDAANLINTTRVFRFFSKPCPPDVLLAGIDDALRESTSTQLAPSLERLSGIFGLTGSEARLTQALVLGKSLDDAATEIGVTSSSARTYLKRVFSKTDSKRQAELVSKVLLAIHQ